MRTCLCLLHGIGNRLRCCLRPTAPPAALPRRPVNCHDFFPFSVQIPAPFSPSLRPPGLPPWGKPQCWQRQRLPFPSLIDAVRFLPQTGRVLIFATLNLQAARIHQTRPASASAKKTSPLPYIESTISRERGQVNLPRRKTLRRTARPPWDKGILSCPPVMFVHAKAPFLPVRWLV